MMAGESLSILAAGLDLYILQLSTREILYNPIYILMGWRSMIM